MINEKNTKSKFYYPSCKNDNCDGAVNIEINQNNFSLDYVCEKNKEHNGKNIYFKMFERFYLKESSIDKCMKCNSILENFIRYKCKLCDNCFCSDCIFLDKHISKNNKNLIISSFKCSIHNANYIYFCKECNVYLCNYCIKDESNEHNEHQKTNLYELMPTKNQIEKIKNRLNDYDELIKKIDSWMKELNNKVERLKRNILDEKELIYKLVYNFNQRFFNYSYFYNLNYIYDYIDEFNNDYLDRFFNQYNFDEKSKILLEYFNDLEKKEKEKTKLKTNVEYYGDDCLDKIYSLNKCKFTKITDNYIFLYNHKEIKVAKYDDKSQEIQILTNTILTNKNQIKYVSVHDNKNQTYTIYACLTYQNEVRIFNFDLNSGVLEKCEDKIYKFKHHFNSAIQLTNDLVATTNKEEDQIDIWIKDTESITGFTCLNEIELNTEITSILPVDNEIFILFFYGDNEINFYDIKSLSVIKSLNDIDFIDDKNFFLLFKNQYLMICLRKGFYIISIKTKEIVQYIEDYRYYFSKKQILLSSNDTVYLAYIQEKKNNSEDSDESSENMEIEFNIYLLSYTDVGFHATDEYLNIKVNEPTKLMLINDKELLFCNTGLFLLNEND